MILLAITCYYYWKCNLVSAIFYCHHIYCFLLLFFIMNDDWSADSI